MPKKACIVHTSHPDIHRTAHVIKKVLEQWGWKTTMKPAEEARIPDLTPVDLMFFGAEDSVSLPSSSYGELFRSLQGVNFAGRKGALFSTSTGGVEALRKMVQDSELVLSRSPLVVKKDTTEGSVETWLRTMVETS
jgi:hypothetical protein